MDNWSHKIKYDKNGIIGEETKIASVVENMVVLVSVVWECMRRFIKLIRRIYEM